MSQSVPERCPDAIETARLWIRPPRPGDGAEVNAAIRETYDDLHAWMVWADHVPSVEETEAHCQGACTNFEKGQDFTLQAYLKDGRTAVVRAGLHPRDWKVPSFEIGYWCRASFQGQGYVTEAVHAITHTGFEILGANRIEIRCDPHNVRSRGVAERVGYRLEAELRNEQVGPDGNIRNTLIYALCPDEYERMKAEIGAGVRFVFTTSS